MRGIIQRLVVGVVGAGGAVAGAMGMHNEFPPLQRGRTLLAIAAKLQSLERRGDFIPVTCRYL